MNNKKSEKLLKPWLKNYDAHVKPELLYPDVSLVDLLKEQVSQHPSQSFLIFQNKSYTYLQIWNYVITLSQNLVGLGMKKKDRVAIMLPNCPQFVIAYYAALNAGAAVIAINPTFHPPEYRPLFQKTQPKIIICTENHIAEFIEEKEAEKYEKWIISSGIGELEPFSSENVSDIDNIHLFSFNSLINERIGNLHAVVPEVNPSDQCVFQFSGGTTGTPKAAIGLHKNIVANVTQFINWCDLRPGKETVLAAIPLYHVYGMVLAMNMCMALGARMVLIKDPRDVDEILDSIEKYSVSFYPGVPAMYHAINHNDRVKNGDLKLKSLKVCISGSYTLHKSIKNYFEKYTGAKLVEGYGLSEAPTATHCNPVYGLNKTGSIGLPLPDVYCRVVDLDTGTHDVELGEIGELIIRGPQIMDGYFEEPEEEKQILRDGWLFTGDVVRMDEDGYFFIVDRKKSLIKVGGLQVWPNEIEAVINLHPDVIECAVGGIPEPASGEKVIAWVIKKEDSQILEQNIIDWCHDKLVNYKIPGEVYFVSDIPKTGVGKILRRLLIQQYLKKTQNI